MNQTKLIVTYFKLNEQERTESYLCGSAGDILKNRKLAVGYAHIALLNADGTVSAHGDNSRGQCDTQSWQAVTKVVAGDFHTAALKSDGTVYATGDNAYGQCNVNGWCGVTELYANKGLTVGVTAGGALLFSGQTIKTPAEASLTSEQQESFELLKKLLKPEAVNDASADKPVSGVYNDFEYVITGGKASITKYKGNAKTVVIPEEIGGIPVRSIGKKAFYVNENISSLVLSENLREIGDDAFWYCEKLSEIEMPYGVETIGKNAFFNCDIKELILPESVKRIGVYAFRQNYSLNKLVIPDSIEAIENFAFPSAVRRRTEISAETKKRLKNYDYLFF